VFTQTEGRPVPGSADRYSTTALRGALSAAVRAGDHQAEAELRRELALCNVERTLFEQLGDRPLTVVEHRRLRLALESYAAPRRSAEPVGAATNGDAA
jgi:hypothetical protein